MPEIVVKKLEAWQSELKILILLFTGMRYFSMAKLVWLFFDIYWNTVTN